jgi:hypothetical protein
MKENEMSATQAARDRFADYVPVSERLEHFYSDHPQGRILTNIVEHDAENGFVLIRAEVYREQGDAVPSATGHAFENRSEGYVNKTSYIENCETSATGRALAMLGYEIKRGIASREEMEKTDRMSAEPGHAENVCPNCGETKAVIKGKAEYGGGWLCFLKKGGCGAKWGGEAEEKPKRASSKDVNESRRVLIQSVADAFKLLNKLGDVPPWTKRSVNEYVALHFQGAAGVDELEDEQVSDLLRMLSEKINSLKGGDEKKKGLIASIETNFDTPQHLENYMKDHGGKNLEELSIPELEAIEKEVGVPF